MSNSGAATPVLNLRNEQQLNFPNAAAQPAAASAGPTLHRTTTVVGHTLTPNGRPRFIAHNPNRQNNLDNFTLLQQQIEASAATSGQSAAASTNNSKMNTNQGGKRKRSIRKTHLKMKKTRRTLRNKNKRTRKH